MEGRFPSYTLMDYTAEGVTHMRDDLEQRACELAVYMIENRATVRAAAKRFGISK